MPPRRFPTSLAALTAVVTSWALAPAAASAGMLDDLASQMQGALDSGSYGLALLVCYGAGLGTAFTPCVYPMIAITVAVFGARQAKSRLEGAFLSAVFVLGMATLFTPLGVIAAMTGQSFGATNANPWVMSALALLFLAMAASMFGAFEMTLPPALQNRLAQIGGSGPKGAFGIGFVNGLIAAPCTGPVLTVLLAWVATSRNVGFGALALFVYSLGLGTLFFLVGTFAVSLPKSGVWLDRVKSVFGIVMVVLAFYYVRALLPFPRPVIRDGGFLAVAAGVTVVGFLAGAVNRSFKEGTGLSRVLKGVGVVAVSTGLLGAIFWAEALPPGAHITWREDFTAARAEAQTAGRPMLVDFGAEWCGACKELEHEALSDPRVVAEAERFVTVRVDLSTGRATPDKWALLRDYRQPGLPLVVLHGRDGSERHRVTSPVNADEFLELLRAVD